MFWSRAGRRSLSKCVGGGGGGGGGKAEFIQSMDLPAGVLFYYSASLLYSTLRSLLSPALAHDNNSGGGCCCNNSTSFSAVL